MPDEPNTLPNPTPSVPELEKVGQEGVKTTGIPWGKIFDFIVKYVAIPAFLLTLLALIMNYALAVQRRISILEGQIQILLDDRKSFNDEKFKMLEKEVKEGQNKTNATPSATPKGQ